MNFVTSIQIATIPFKTYDSGREKNAASGVGHGRIDSPATDSVQENIWLNTKLFVEDMRCTRESD
jgi:hypothetical protein